MAKKKNAAATTTAAEILKLKTYYSTEEENSDKKIAETLPRYAGFSERVIQDRAAAILASKVVGICAEIDVFIDFAGFKLLKKFFKKFLAMYNNKTKVTRKKLQKWFDRIFEEKKYSTQTQDAVYFAGDIACGLCVDEIFCLNF